MAKPAKKISFEKLRSGRLAYAENGHLKGYANITQAENKVQALKEQGYDVYRTFSHPFYIVLNS